MTKLIAIATLLFTVLIGSTGVSYALPPCPGSPSKSPTTASSWTNCYGVWIISTGSNAGYRYAGEWRDGKQQGQGTSIFSAPHKYAGQKYVGEFKDSKRHGQGTVTFASGSKYVGEYKDGKKHGQGTYTWGPKTKSAGDKYVGEYKDGKKHGQGTYTWADGRVDVGEWKNSVMHGHGIRYRTNGTVYQEGIFENDKFLYAKKLPPKPPVVAKVKPKQTQPNSSNSSKVYRTGSGTGFAITNSGYLVTNNHVIKGCAKVRIHQKGESVPATIVARDNLNDLALLKGKFKPSKIFKLSRKPPSLTDEIFVVGYPFGRKISSSVKVTKGIVSSLTGLGNNYSNIQIDAAIQPGNSGGPIINEMGNVIGVAVARLDKIKVLKKLGSLPELTNFGIKSSVVLNLLQGNNVKVGDPHRTKMKKSERIQVMTNATYYLSCWMTMAQIKTMKQKKVMFQDLKVD